MPERTRPKWCSPGGWCLAVAVAAAVGPGSAEAQVSDPVPVVEYEAPASCPDRASWLADVRARLARGRSVRPGTSGAARVHIEPGGTRASLWFDGHTRSVVGEDCAEVAAASALIVAVALGASPAPLHAGAPSRGVSGPVPPEPGSAPPEPPRAVVKAALAAPPRRSPAPAAEPAFEERDAPASVAIQAAAEPEPARDAVAAKAGAAAARGRWGLDVGVHGELDTWLDASPLRAIGVSVEALAPARSWSLRAGGVYAIGEGNAGARRATLSYLGGHLDLCPLVLGGAAWRWTSCGELHLGVLQASGDGASALATPLAQRALGASVAAVTRLQTPRLWAFRLELEAGAVVPLLRQTFQFEAPEEVVFRTPDVGVLGRAGLRFPLDGVE